MKSVLEERKKRNEKIFTGAYVISASNDKTVSKAEYITYQVIGGLWMRSGEFDLHFSHRPTLYETHWLLKQTKGWGNFMAYQAVIDMRYTNLLNTAPDIEKWAAAGPGTIRGLNRVYGRELNFPLSQTQALDEILAVFPLVEPNTGVKIDFNDTTGLFCEVDKYLRVKNGEGAPRARY